MEDFLQTPFNYLIAFAEACGAFVIFIGIVRAIIGYTRQFVIKNPDAKAVSDLRLQLGQCMVIALEFQVAADILKTGISPTWGDILLLAAIIALRTVLNYLLELEIEALRSDE